MAKPEKFLLDIVSMNDKKSSTNQKEEIVSINLQSSSPDKAIPKFCTSVTFSKLKSGNIIMSFHASDPLIPNTATLIERVIVEEDHAKQIIEKLSEVITLKKDGN